ncbi:hypothetical protein MtrunA17_Chr6g0465461 [Medicago truncatula]|uniref:Uncharacterized protein n=1 Tax=Medicago truncatula TaxID=3880 RepID=A0A396HEY4_MEDTR|nr:hypothetical protein MtrunA17_Chr6g0465461 [Medicago truncatula]
MGFRGFRYFCCCVGFNIDFWSWLCYWWLSFNGFGGSYLLGGVFTDVLMYAM